MRSWIYGAKLVQRRALSPDGELVAVAVLLHDLGLARGGSPDRRFEVVGADLGRAFALSHNMGERRAEVVWDAIALHTTASIAQHKGADVACCQHGIACDYGGLGYQELGEDDKKDIAFSWLSTGERLDDVGCDAGAVCTEAIMASPARPTNHEAQRRADCDPRRQCPYRSVGVVEEQQWHSHGPV
jgi:hypothetical protein